jgi:cation transport regulator ChaB
MTYKTIYHLPETIRKVLPEAAQEIYLEAHNASWDSCDEETEPGALDRESVAHRDGWTAVHREFVHDEKKGVWYRKGEEPDEAEEDQGLLDKLKDALP